MGNKTSGRRRRSQADASEADGPRAEAKRRLEEYARRKGQAASQEDDPRHRPTPHIPVDGEPQPAGLADWEPEEPLATETSTPAAGAVPPGSEGSPLDGAGVQPEADAVPVEEVQEAEPLRQAGLELPSRDEDTPGEPKLDAAEASYAPEVQPVMTAPLGRRLLAYLVDLSLAVIFATLNVVVAAHVLGTSSRTLFAERTVPFVAFGLLLVLTTLMLGVRLGGQTPGLCLMGLEITSFRGGGVSLGRSLLRAVTLLAGSAVLGAAGLSAALDPERRGFVDRWAGTEVVQREEY